MRCCSAALAAPTADWLTFAALNSPRLEQFVALVQVYMLRLTANGGLDEGGPLLSRRTPPTPPFSTAGPSGRSGTTFDGIVVHSPALDGEKSQYGPLTVVQ